MKPFLSPEPRSDDAELEPFEDDDDDDDLDMRDGTEELSDDDENDSDALEPTDREVASDGFVFEYVIRI